MIKHIWIEQADVEGFDPFADSTDVIVQTEDDRTWSSSFVTVTYLQRQMALSQDVARGLRDMSPVRFVALETPHVIVENLLVETIEDTIDNLMTLGVFESVFMLVRDDMPMLALA